MFCVHIHRITLEYHVKNVVSKYGKHSVLQLQEANKWPHCITMFFGHLPWYYHIIRRSAVYFQYHCIF